MPTRTDGLGLREFLADRDCPCPGCGYNLRNLQSSRCPECAMEIQLTVGLVEPRIGALIVGTVALAAGAGFGALLMGFGVIMTMTKGGPPAMDPFFTVNGTVAAVNGLALWMWLRCWRSVRRWSARASMGLAIACWILPIAGMLALVKWVR